MRIRLFVAALFFCLSCMQIMHAQSADLSGIAHVAFRVSDLEKSRQFYERLGFQQAFEFTDAGKVTQAFIKINDRQFIELYPLQQESQALGLTHVCYEAHDIESVRNAYLKQGLNPPEAKKARAGNLLFVLHDPDGQLVEYTQYLPGSLHSEDRGKHLGEHRISNHLQSATVLVKDVPAERAFYVDKLGFREVTAKADRLKLQIPGGSGDQLEIAPLAATTQSQITFLTIDTKQVAKALRGLGLKPTVMHGTVQVNDLDGNVIAFTSIQEKHSHDESKY